MGDERLDQQKAKRALRHIEKAILAMTGQPRVGSVSSYLHSAFQELETAILTNDSGGQE